MKNSGSGPKKAVSPRPDALIFGLMTLQKKIEKMHVLRKGGEAKIPGNQGQGSGTLQNRPPRNVHL